MVRVPNKICKCNISYFLKMKGRNMKNKKSIFFYLMLGIIFSAQLVYADACDDIFKQAKGRVKLAKEASNEKNYPLALQFYQEAAWYYEQVVSIDKCRCPKIHGLSQENAKHYKALADKYEKFINNQKKHGQQK
jgi:hypothetical protein